MRLSSLLPPALLLASTHASTSPPADEPAPVGAVWAAKWDTATLSPYTQHCRTTTTHTAKIYKLSEMYPDLEDQAPQLKVFYSGQLYAGSWDGVDVHGGGRELIRMKMADVPFKVREWMKRESKQKHYSVQDDEVFFAPGAIYPILPLWVEREDGGEEKGEEGCEGVFEGLERYSNEPEDGKVIGKVTHEGVGEKEVRFTVEAMVVRRKEGEGEKVEL
ncbi:Phenylacetaldoxime dehydratase [Pyrenophora seminiperda CCB06]|uniref:Phenylacetaldoxime dehydratase n=1 Tax=Pyrenophora seminiperda CCB06 TaxID=1302712 RepID=A0A3M7M0J1_9PLEO|nr:Phenylacetaldoxime dehydratase [Pyrenophora seminiperda CCB06]